MNTIPTVNQLHSTSVASTFNMCAAVGIINLIQPNLMIGLFTIKLQNAMIVKVVFQHCILRYYPVV